MDIMVVVNQMIQLFIMITVGFIVAKMGLIQSDFNQRLTKFVLNLTMPCMIVASVMSSQSYQIALKDIMISTVLLVLVLPVFAYLCIRFLPLEKYKGLYMFMIMYPNVGFMGFPLMQSIFGSESILSTAIINMGFNLSLFTLGIIVMNYGQNQRPDLNIKNLLSPGVISSLLAILIYILKITVPQVIVNPITLIGNMTTPLAMMIIGATLSLYNFKEIFSDIKVYVFTIFIDVVVPIVFFPLITLLIQDSMIQGITLIIIAMPVANGAVLFAKTYGQDEFLAAKTVFISTMMAILTIPLLVYLFLV